MTVRGLSRLMISHALSRGDLMIKAFGGPRGEWSCSTAFSGLGCPELASGFLMKAWGSSIFHFVNGIEWDPVARSVSADHSPDTPLHHDILSWLRPSARARIQGLDGSELRSAVFDKRSSLMMCSSVAGTYHFGDMHIAGPPCVDFSAMGAGRREKGPTMACFLVWARALLHACPMVIIFENV